MKRADITVILKDGRRYDANHISIVRATRSGQSGEYWNESRIVFQCSGGAELFWANEVASMEYRDGTQESGGTVGYCSECDASLAHMVGRPPGVVVAS